MVRQIVREASLKIPEDVTLTLKKKVITVKGKLGELSRSFAKMPIEFITI